MKTVQEVLEMDTEQGSLNAIAIGWTCTNPISGGRFDQCHETPLDALAVGWKLLAPPTRRVDTTAKLWEWWFVRDVEV